MSRLFDTTIYAAFVLLLSLFIAASFFAQNAKKKLPRSGKAPGLFSLAEAKREFVDRGFSIINKGYQQYKDGMFLVQTADMERIVLSTKYLDELKSTPEEVLSLAVGMSQRHLGQYTGLNIILTSHLQSAVCKVHLTQNLHRLVGPIREETRFWLSKLAPPSLGQPVELKGYDTLLRAIAAVTSRVFVDLPMSRDEDWIRTIENYTLDVFRISMELRRYHPFLRPFVAPWLGCIKRVNRHVQETENRFSHIFARKLAQTQGKQDGDDMIQCLVDTAEGNDRRPGVLIRKLLFLTLAATHTSTVSATHALYDLCTYPEYAEPLRREIREVIGSQGWTLQAINQLKLLDSFVKESQRLNHPGLLSFNRKVIQTIHLSDGEEIPKGSFISMATNSVARDPEYYPEPDRFDGFRFYKKRLESPSDANKHQFATTSTDNLAFGYGRAACPGRFYAAVQVKTLIASILLQYDVSFGGGLTDRPPNIFYGEGIGPDRSQTVIFDPVTDFI